MACVRQPASVSRIAGQQPWPGLDSNSGQDWPASLGRISELAWPGLLASNPGQDWPAILARIAMASNSGQENLANLTIAQPVII